MIPTTSIDLAITLALAMMTKAGEFSAKIAAAQAGGPPITDADLDAAAVLVGTSRQALVDEIAAAKAGGR